MSSNNTQQATKPNPKFNPQQQHHHNRRQHIRKVPPRAPSSKRHNIYINTKTDLKAQIKRCEDLLSSSEVGEIYLHCLGYAITTGINLALQLISRSSEALDYTINTSTIHLIDELHPLCDTDDISLRPRNNSALHIKVYNKNVLGTATKTEQQHSTSRQPTAAVAGASAKSQGRHQTKSSTTTQ